MTCPHCTPSKRCDSCERVAIVHAWWCSPSGTSDRADVLELLSALDAHDRARLAAPEMVERVARALHAADPHSSETPWEQLADYWRDGFTKRARAALAALTEAT